MIDGLRAAIGLLTILPAGQMRDYRTAARRAAFWIPVVAIAEGAVIAGVWLLASLVVDGWVAAFITVVAWLVVTGGLHLDGWVDCCDALFASTSRERRLEILKDVRTGAFGVAGAVVLIVGQVIAVRAAGSGGAAAVLLAFACSASVMVSSMAVFRYAGQPDSLGAGFAAGAGVPAAVVAGMVVVGAGWLLLGGPGLVAAAIGSAAGLVFSAFASRRLGGVTGDVYGAGGQLAALVTMLVVPPLAGGAS